MLSLVPDLPGDLLISASTYGSFENEMRGRRALQMGSSQFMRTSVGRGRFLADGGGRTPLAEWCSLELHTDGSGVFGMRLVDMYEGKRQEGQSVTDLVADESLASTMMGGLVWLGSHAQERAAAGGKRCRSGAVGSGEWRVFDRDRSHPVLRDGGDAQRSGSGGHYACR